MASYGTASFVEEAADAARGMGSASPGRGLLYHDVVPGSRANDDPALCPTVDLEIHEIVNCEEILRSYGLNVVCDHCGDEQESVTAIVTVRSEPPDRFTLCGLCYRKLCELALGEVC